MRVISVILMLLVMASSCTQKPGSPAENIQFIPEQALDKVKNLLKEKHGSESSLRIDRGVEQLAALWRPSDGTPQEFEEFIVQNFLPAGEELNQLYNRLERNFEILNGYFHKMNVALKEPLHLEGPPVENVDMMFGSYNPSAHLTDDFFANKIAFLTALNFPFYSLKEKTELGMNWSRREWAFARMGDQFVSRVPAEVIQNVSKVLTAADAYISDYNIYMGKLVNNEGKALFPEGLKLITHWGLRYELKSQYASAEGLEKQRMIYQVMQRIIGQDRKSVV